jgi:hypothetical protein
MMSFQFGNVVVVDDDRIGVIVKSWADGTHEVYVRDYNIVSVYPSSAIRHYIYSKYLLDEQKEFY